MSTFTTSNPTTIGEPTKKDDYDKVFENTLWCYDSLGDMATASILVGQGTAANPEAKAVSGDISSISTAGAFMIAADAITQSKLKTTSGSVSNATTNMTNNTLPGGEYGFYPRVDTDNAGGAVQASITTGTGVVTGSYITNIAIRITNVAYTAYANQRYVTSSGEVFWIFILRRKSDNKIISIWQAPDHPCFGNGAKPALVEHPFSNFDPGAEEIIVVTPTKQQVLDIWKKTESGSENEPDKDFIKALTDNYEIDEVSSPKWPTLDVTVGLPPGWDDAWLSGKPVEPIKKKIPKPAYVLHKDLKAKGI